jgi:putative transposase
MQVRGFRFKLHPTPEQESAFRAFSGVCRLVYNLALDQRENWWRQFRRQTGGNLNYFAQSKELTLLRAEFDWIAAVAQTCPQQALMDLDRAFTNFFAGRAHYPTPRRKGVNDAFRFLGREVQVRRLNDKWSSVRLPKIGWVKFRDTRPIRGQIRNATVSHDALGWHVSFACAFEAPAVDHVGTSVGIDRGVTNTLALSTGEMFSIPACLLVVERRQRAAQRVLARRKRGSKRRLKQLRRCAKLSAKRARIRKDWCHRVTTGLAKRFGTVVLEDLKIANMTASAAGTLDEPGKGVSQKRGLNRAILNQGWSQFETLLSYKLEERGGFLCKVPAQHTSQTCSACGCIDKRSRESQARFVCHHCGFEIHADTNAAIEILRRNTAWMRMEERGFPSDEVRTTQEGLSLLGNPSASAGGGC